MSFYPKDYQNKIDIAQEMMEQAEQLDKMELPTHEDIEREINNAQKEINSSGSIIGNLAKDLLNSLHADIHEDMENALKEYAHEVNTYQENAYDDLDAFPYYEWLSCAKFSDKRYAVNLSFSLFTTYNKYASTQTDKEDLFLYNISSFIQDAYKAFINRELLGNKFIHLLIEIKKYMEKENKLNYFHNIFYADSLKSQNQEQWKKFSIYHLCATWSDELERNYAFEKLATQIKTKNQDSKQVVNILFAPDSGLYNLYHFRSGTQSVTSLNWGIIHQLIEMDFKHNTELSSLILNHIEEVAKKFSYSIDKNAFDMDYAQTLSLHQKLILENKLEKRDEPRALRKI